MFGLIFGVILLIAGIITGVSLYNAKFYSYSKNKSDYFARPFVKWIITGSAALCIIFTLLGCIASIDTGHTGIITIFGKVEDRTLDSGIHFTAPWEHIIEMDNRVQKAPIELSCFSSDIQEVVCKYTVNYKINKENAQNLYKTVGVNYYDTAIVPTVAECVKTIMAHYSAEQLVNTRDKLAMEIEELLKQELEKYNIDIVSTAMEDLDFTDAFTNAVEAKQVAAQNKLKAEIEQAQSIKQAEADAEVARVKAEADANVGKIKADKDRYAKEQEAAGNSALNNSLTDKLVTYYQIEKWDGKYPTQYVGSDNVSTILNTK